MIRLRLSKQESFLLLLCLESFLPEATEGEAEALEALLFKLQESAPAAPFKSATEARKSRFLSP